MKNGWNAKSPRGKGAKKRSGAYQALEGALQAQSGVTQARLVVAQYR
ncbi:MAG: hypothetical protein GW911_27955 [Armatimonadetes bacterium]|nr:hypothetical protein [Armatimonadota bacterium]NCO95450.1 hypothetical protein [Armatimonadota bacterium]NCP32888.1 hypothetical protein [Armatimonadota bacterium]NCQ31133.1 hypothetical protein [Armatimonadota bacterium]NDK15884.1 hypothetical protein [Armatimonadota bacterium]